MIAVLLKLVDLRVEVDPLTGEPGAAAAGQTLSASPADRAALETALQLAGAGEEVVAVSAGPSLTADATDTLLREALAVGAARAVRVEIPAGTSSADVAAAIAPVITEARIVVCGDASLDRGSGAVPAFVAHHLKAAQALGLTTVSPAGEGLRVERRLDGGRREVLEVTAPAVLSVEEGLRLRRASLAALIRAREAAIEVVTQPAAIHAEGPPERLRPYRAPAPAASSQPAPDDPRARVLALTGMLAPARARRVVEADPATCVDELLDYLAAHGYR